MLSAKLTEEITKQVNEELFSSYLYLSMALCFESKNFKGTANWLKVQSQEEYGHAMKFIHYAQERGANVVLKAIETPKAEWDNHINAFTEVLKHENHITERINHLMSIAYDEKDYASISFLQWFVNEQVEEESNATYILERVKMVGESLSGILYVDKELGKRAS